MRTASMEVDRSWITELPYTVVKGQPDSPGKQPLCLCTSDVK